MLFPGGLLPDLPQLETRKALLLIDLQTDFLREDGKLFVKNATEFLHRLPSLVSKFREKGEVFWVQSEFHQTRPTISPELGRYVIVLEECLDSKESSQASGDQLEEQDALNSGREVQSCGSSDPEAFFAARSNSHSPRCCLPSTIGCASPKSIASIIDLERDSSITKTDYSAFETKSLLPTLRMKLVTQLYLCGSLSNVSVFATALDAVRHGLEVTIIEDCVGFRSPRCHKEAMRQMADAMGVNGTDYLELMDELNDNLGDIVTPSTFNSTVGMRQTARSATPENYTMRVKVKRWMEDGNDGIQINEDPSGTDDIVNVQAGSAKRRSTSNGSGPSVASRKAPENGSKSASALQKRSSDESDGAEPPKSVSRASQNAKPSRIRMRRSHQAAVEESTSPATHKKEVIHEPKSEKVAWQGSTATIEADSDPDRSLLEDMSVLVDKAKAIGRTLRGAKRSGPASGKLLGPGDFIGERDSRIVYDFLPKTNDFDDAFAKLRSDDQSCEVRWQKMYHRTGEVPRLVAVQGEANLDGSIPIYRHPADESPPLLPFSPTVQGIRREVEKAIGHPFNHVLIQLYRGGEDNISEHSDKTLDIVGGSFIVNVSLGAMRTMTLRTKKSAHPTQKESQQRRASGPASNSPSNADVKRAAQQVPLPHNSLFVLGQATNQVWLHAIRADKRPVAEKTPEELAFAGERISLTFRHIGTFIDPQAGKIWGQGATGKTQAEANPILEGQEAAKEGERMIRAFGRENHQSHDFDWQAQYGHGFNVVNFTTKDDCGDTG